MLLSIKICTKTDHKISNRVSKSTYMYSSHNFAAFIDGNPITAPSVFCLEHFSAQESYFIVIRKE